MTLESGLGSQFGLAVETVYGTVVTPNRFFEFDSAAVALDQNYQDGVGLKANRMFQPAGRMRKTTRSAGGASPMDIPNKGFGAIVNLMHDLVVTPAQLGSTAAYKQTHNIGTSMPRKSATVQVNKPTSQGVDVPHTYPGSVLASVAFSVDANGILKATPTWMAQDELTPDTTPAGPALASASYPTGLSSWVGVDAGSTVTMNGTPVAVVRSAQWTWTQPRKDDRWFLGTGGTRLKPIPNGFSTVAGTVELEWFDKTAYNLFRSGALIAIVFDFVGAQIESPNNEEIKFTLSSCQLRGSSPTIDGPDVLSVSVPFTAGDDGTNPPLKIEYTSTDVTL
jgi:hypothetical protein